MLDQIVTKLDYIVATFCDFLQQHMVNVTVWL